MAAQGVLGPNVELGERGASKEALPGTACSVPGKGANPRGGRGFQHFRRRFPPGFCFVSPGRGFNCMEGVLFADETLSSPPGIIFRIPGMFGSAVERPTLCPQVSGSSLAYWCFFPFFLFCMGFNICCTWYI